MRVQLWEKLSISADSIQSYKYILPAISIYIICMYVDPTYVIKCKIWHYSCTFVHKNRPRHNTCIVRKQRPLHRYICSQKARKASEVARAHTICTVAGPWRALRTCARNCSQTQIQNSTETYCYTLISDETYIRAHTHTHTHTHTHIRKRTHAHA
jgi:hypothetical protein